MTEQQKVPLAVGWLSENGLLDRAGALLGYTFGPALELGVMTTHVTETKPSVMLWKDRFLFTVAQLLELGFMPGEFKYCPCCKRLQVDCDKEREEIAAHDD